ncbi:MAG: aminopeptidase P family protein [Gemmatimonadota bacterium]|nr:aminopeptidase P family protein [Gemmatimonadota bacterium]
MEDRRPHRLAALRASLAESGFDAMLVTSLPNIRYLTGFSGSAGLLVVPALEPPVLLTDFRYEAQVGDEVGDSARVRIETSSLWTGVRDVLAAIVDGQVVAYESAHLLVVDHDRLADLAGRWQWRGSVGIVESLRERKDAGELTLIREAVRIAEAALDRTIREVRLGLTERQVAGILEHHLRDLGSDATPFETIVASGPRAALPHARASTRRLEGGEFLLIDFGASYSGYCSDITRTFALQSVNPEMQAIHDIVREATLSASAGVRAGMRGRDADAIARGYIEGRGYGALFGHSLGHGIGLEVHEGPRLARTAEAPLPVGAVVTIEPGIYRPGWGGVRIEDDVHLTEEGPDVLRSFPRELLVIA